MPTMIIIKMLLPDQQFEQCPREGHPLYQYTQPQWQTSLTAASKVFLSMMASTSRTGRHKKNSSAKLLTDRQMAVVIVNSIRSLVITFLIVL